MAKGRGGFIGQDGLNAPDSPTGVSATAGDTEATVSWTNPTDVGGSAITNYHIQSSNGDGSIVYPSYTLNGASYDNIDSAALSSQIGQGQGLFFKSDGLKMYASDQSNAYQYSLSTAWDLSTISYDSKSLSLSTASDPNNTFFKSDGTKFYVVSKNDSYILEFDVSTAWDISTGSSGYSRRYLVSSQMSNPSGIFFKPDGTKMYVLGGADTVYQYSLSTAWNVTTASYDSKSFSVTSEETNPRSILLNDDGTKLFVVGYGNDTLFEYALSTAYDISTASYSNYSLDISSESTFPYSMFFKSDGKKLYVFGATTDKIHQYSTGLSVGDLLTSPITLSGLTNGTSYTFNVWAINAFGWSSPSDASGSVSPVAPIGAFSLGYDGGATPINVINKITISSTGNASDFGDLLTNKNVEKASLSSATRAIFLGGQGPSGGSDKTNVIEYKEFSSSGNTVDFGDVSEATQSGSGSGSDTRGLFGLPNTSTVEYITYASTGNSTTFGDYTVMTYCNRNTAVSSNTRVVFCGNSDTAEDDIMEYFTIASTGNGTDFGDLIVPVGAPAKGQMSSGTRGIIAGGLDGGGSYVNTIQYITIASTGNSTDFGDISTTAQTGGACSSTSRGVFTLGLASGGGAVNTIEYITIGSTGNSADFGDLTQTAYYSAGCSNAHGGLS